MSPIIKKELKVTARSLRFPISLMIYGLVTSYIVMLIVNSLVDSYYREYSTYYTYGGYMDYSSMITTFFVLVAVQVGIISVIIPAITASSIAGERERQTLDILLTSPITPTGIVLGKLFSALANVLMYIICTMPALAITFMFGGVSIKYLFIFLVEMIAMSFAWGSIGVYNSAVFKRTVASIVMSLIWEGIICIGPFIGLGIYYLLLLQRYYAYGGSGPINLGLAPLLLLFSPAIGFFDAMYHAYSGEYFSIGSWFYGGQYAPIVDKIAPYADIISLVITILIGLLFVRLAARRVNYVGRKEKKLKKKGA